MVLNSSGRFAAAVLAVCLGLAGLAAGQKGKNEKNGQNNQKDDGQQNQNDDGSGRIKPGEAVLRAEQGARPNAAALAAVVGGVAAALPGNEFRREGILRAEPRNGKNEGNGQNNQNDDGQLNQKDDGQQNQRGKNQ
ncbi:MAG: hypothetical protein JWO38_5270 [Gemmataceae bacterium]|nr:hypothetical protein [Gemmataceae bacterium]